MQGHTGIDFVIGYILLLLCIVHASTILSRKVNDQFLSYLCFMRDLPQEQCYAAMPDMLQALEACTELLVLDFSPCPYRNKALTLTACTRSGAGVHKRCV